MLTILCDLEKFRDTIYLSDDREYLNKKKEEGKAVVFLELEGEEQESFSSFRYTVFLTKEEHRSILSFRDANGVRILSREQGQTVLDWDYLDWVYCRLKGIPNRIALSKRLEIRELTVEDVKDVEEIFTSEETSCFLEGFINGENPEQMIEEYVKHAYDLSSYGMWGVTIRREDIPMEKHRGKGTAYPDGNNIIGIVSLLVRHRVKRGEEWQAIEDKSVESEYREPDLVMELGFALKKKYWHRGYAREMCQAVLQEMIEKNTSQEDILVFSKTRKENTAARRLLERLGFVLEEEKLPDCFPMKDDAEFVVFVRKY